MKFVYWLASCAVTVFFEAKKRKLHMICMYFISVGGKFVKFVNNIRYDLYIISNDLILIVFN